MRSKVTWKIGGEAGFGIMASGTILAKAFTRQGYHVIAANEYPSLIRGGHNAITVGIGTDVFYSLNRDVNILVALNKETVDLHNHELVPGSMLVFDPKDYTWNASEVPDGVVLVSLPMTEMTKEVGGEPVMRNTIAVGATVALLGSDFTILEKVLTDQFGKKGADVVSENVKAAKAGYDAIKKNFSTQLDMALSPTATKEKQLLLNASEAVGLGALAGGVNFAAIYPMTPINALIGLFADHEKDLQMVYIQPEDEIAGINMAIGASLGGAKSMVATSGGGFALMVEGLSMTGIMEVPLVIDLGMRPGPATGMPTWTEQGELGFAVHAGHGEFSRIILAPGDVEESYTLTKKAFDLSSKYQIPVFVLTDKYLNENLWCTKESVFTAPQEPFVEPKPTLNTAEGYFKRYAFSPNGVSPRSLPGDAGGEYLASSYEHDETGYTTEESHVRKDMADKRMKKTEAILSEIPAPSVYGVDNADVTFVSFGSTKGPILEAMLLLGKKNMKTKLIHFSWVYPMPKGIAGLLGKEKRIICVEGNGTGQLEALIREESGFVIKEHMRKYDGRQFFPEEIVEQVKN